MKNLIILLLLVSVQAVAQKTTVLLKGGKTSPSFTYTECFNKLTGKDRYCNRYDYTLYIEDNTLVIVETKVSHSDVPKKSTSYSNEYRVNIADIDIIRSLDDLKNGKDVYRIKNMEGSEQRFYRFTLYSKYGDGIKTTEYGKPKGLESMTMYADFRSDATDFLEHLLAWAY